MSADDTPEALGGGLVLRSARPDDVEAIVTLECAAFGTSDEPGVRAHLATPAAIRDWAVVTAPAPTASTAGGECIVSASGLLAHRMALDGIGFSAGQIEYVATDPDHQRRGLVRAQFAWHHRRAAERGHRALFIGGIPYLYRRFGYGYGLDFPPARVPGDLAVVDDSSLSIRPAVDGDLAVLRRLEEQRPTTGLRTVRDGDAWTVILATCRANEWEQLWLVERDGRPVGWFRTQRKPEDGRVYLPAAMVDDAEPAMTVRAMLTHARAIAGDDTLLVWEVADAAFSRGLGELDEVGPAWQHDHGIYVRVPDPVALLDTLRPVLSQRLAASRYAARDGELILSFYDSGVALELVGGAVRRVRPVPGIEDPYSVNGVGIAPDWFGALVFGRYGAIGLAERADDVSLGRARGLMEVLFPARPSDVVGEF